MATLGSTTPFPKIHPRRGRLLIFIILAVIGVSLFTMKHVFDRIKNLSGLVSVLEHRFYENKVALGTLSSHHEMYSQTLASSRAEVDRLSSLLNKYRMDLSKISGDLSSTGQQNDNGVTPKMVQDLNIAITKQSQEITNIKNELKISENVIQAMMTAQVADVKKHEEMWKAIHDLEASVRNQVDVNSLKTVSEAYNRKFEDITRELNVQKAKVEEVKVVMQKESEENKKKVSNQVPIENNSPKVEVVEHKPNMKEDQNLNNKAQKQPVKGGHFDSIKKNVGKVKDSTFKNVDEATRKLAKKIERRASHVANNVEKVKNAFFKLFG